MKNMRLKWPDYVAAAVFLIINLFNEFPLIENLEDLYLSLRWVTTIICIIIFLGHRYVEWLKKNHLTEQEKTKAEIGQLENNLDLNCRWNKCERKLKEVIDTTTFLDCIQIYSVKDQPSDTKKIFKVSYCCGEVRKDCEINAILQASFEMPYEYYAEFIEATNAISALENYRNTKNYDKVIYAEGIKKALLDLTFLRNRLNTYLENTVIIDDEAAVVYRLYIIIINLTYAYADNDYNNMWGLGLKTAVLANENDFITHKRTGILGGLVLEQAYMFRNIRYHQKHDRIYCVKQITINEIPYSILLSFNNRFIELVQLGQRKYVVDQLIDRIAKELKRSL